MQVQLHLLSHGLLPGHCAKALGLVALLLLFVGTVAAQPTLEVNAIVLDQPVNRMVYDSVRAQLIMTIPATDTINGDRVGFMDPITGTFTHLLDIGAGPHPIDLTDNGLYAFIGLDSSHAVQKLDLNSLEVIETIQFGMDHGMPPAPIGAFRIACQPGNDTAFAVIRSGVFAAGQVDHYNGDSLLYASDHSLMSARAIRFKMGSPDRLVALNPSFGDGTFRTIAVDATALSSLSNLTGLYNETNNFAEVDMLGDLLLTNDGSVIDVSADLPIPLGACAIPYFDDEGARTCFDPYEGLVCAAFRRGITSDTIRVLRFDLETLVAQDAIDVPMPGFFWQVTHILCWGAGNRYALSTSNGDLLIINGEAVPTGVERSGSEAVLPLIQSDGATLRTSNGAGVRFDLLDAQGRYLRRSSEGSLRVDDLPPGTYAIRLFDLSGHSLGAQEWVHVQ